MTSEEAIVWLESVKASEAATAGQAWQMDLCDTAIGLEKRVQALRMAIKRLQPIRYTGTGYVTSSEPGLLIAKFSEFKVYEKAAPNPFYPKD